MALRFLRLSSQIFERQEKTETVSATRQSEKVKFLKVFLGSYYAWIASSNDKWLKTVLNQGHGTIHRSLWQIYRFIPNSCYMVVDCSRAIALQEALELLVAVAAPIWSQLAFCCTMVPKLTCDAPDILDAWLWSLSGSKALQSTCAVRSLTLLSLWWESPYLH